MENGNMGLRGPFASALPPMAAVAQHPVLSAAWFLRSAHNGDWNNGMSDSQKVVVAKWRLFDVCFVIFPASGHMDSLVYRVEKNQINF